MDSLTLFGLASMALMLACYLLEKRSHWFILGFAVCCAMASGYGFLQGAWPFGVMELFWVGAALHRWWGERARAA